MEAVQRILLQICGNPEWMVAGTGGWGYAETVNLQVGCVPGELVSGRTKVVNPCILAGPEDNARGGRR